jgi:Reverse transcriptase (RNA-dependent DNA polymerase)
MVNSGIAQLEADTPKTFKEAITGINKTEWFKAAQKEYDTAVAMKTWKVISRTDLPKGANVITCKWVFKRKHDASGTPTEFKARMTPHGYKQIEGIDFYESY